MSEEPTVRVERDAAIATITIDRPDKLNALDARVVEELHRAVDALATDPGVRCAIVTGAGKAFVAGADIAAMRALDHAGAEAFSRAGHACFDAIEALRFPVIAAVNGFALGGGCELALACDFIYASERAKLGQPEVKLGVVPGFGGTQRLLRRVGLGHARELVYTGAIVSAAEALRIGLVNRIVPADALLDEARATAAAIASMGPVAVSAAKEVMSHGAGLPLREANALEVDAFANCFDTEDQREGMEAFLAKRAPQFVGR